MDVKTYFDTKREMTGYCYKSQCHDNGYNCPLSIMNNGMYVNCTVLEQCYPDKAEKIILEYLDKKFPEGYIVCAKSLRFESVLRCNEYESCTECMAEERS